MASAIRNRKRSQRTVDTTPLCETGQKVEAQIAEYYRQKRLYKEGKLTQKPKLPECTQQKYKDMYDK